MGASSLSWESPTHLRGWGGDVLIRHTLTAPRPPAVWPPAPTRADRPFHRPPRLHPAESPILPLSLHFPRSLFPPNKKRTRWDMSMFMASPGSTPGRARYSPPGHRASRLSRPPVSRVVHTAADASAAGVRAPSTDPGGARRKDRSSGEAALKRAVTDMAGGRGGWHETWRMGGHTDRRGTHARTREAAEHEERDMDPSSTDGTTCSEHARHWNTYAVGALNPGSPTRSIDAPLHIPSASQRCA